MRSSHYQAEFQLKLSHIIDSCLPAGYGRGKRGPMLFDCIGFVVYVLREMGYSVDFPQKALPSWARENFVWHHGDPEPCDVAYFPERVHIAIVEDGEEMADATSGLGVRRFTLHDVEGEKVKYWRVRGR